jgi:circadian clock protein KaiB
MKPAGPGTGAAAGAAPSDAATATAGSYVFRLYVSGATPASARAVVNARRIFATHLPGRYRLEILEIGDHVGQATADQVVATPTLVKLAPLPLRRFIGDLSNVERILGALHLVPAPGAGL